MKAEWEQRGKDLQFVVVSTRYTLIVYKVGKLWFYALIDSRTDSYELMRGPPEGSVQTVRSVKKSALKALADWVAEERKHIEELEKWLTN